MFMKSIEKERQRVIKAYYYCYYNIIEIIVLNEIKLHEQSK